MNAQRIVVNGILRHGGRVLIARRSMTMEVVPGKYHLPGGHVEFGETPGEAIVREFKEEFGVTVEAGRIFQTFSYIIDSIRTDGICFLLSFDGDTGAVKPDNIENDKIVWVAKHELLDYFDVDNHNYIILKQYFGESNLLQ